MAGTTAGLVAVENDPCRKWSVQRSRGNNDDQYAAGDASLNRCRAGAQPNRPISGHRYTRGSAAWRCPNSVVFVLIFLWRHSSKWRGSRSYLVGGLDRLRKTIAEPHSARRKI